MIGGKEPGRVDGACVAVEDRPVKSQSLYGVAVGVVARGGELLLGAGVQYDQGW